MVHARRHDHGLIPPGRKPLPDRRITSGVTPRARTSGAFAMLCAIWGSTWLVIRIGLNGAPPFLGAALRFLVAAVTLLALAAAFRSKLPRTRTEWMLVGFVGLVLFTADYGLIYWGEARGVESGLSAILFASMPFQTALVAHALTAEEKITVPKLAGIALGFGGILLIFRGQLAAAGGAKLLPMAAIVIAATCASFATVAVKRWGHGADPFTFNAFAMAVGTAGLAATSGLAGEAWAVPSWPTGIGAILYLGLAGSVVTFVMYVWLLRNIEATSLSFVAMVTPIVAVMLGVAVGGEVLDPIAIGGAAVTLAGVYLSTSRRAAAWVRAVMGTAVVADAGAPDPPAGKP